MGSFETTTESAVIFAVWVFSEAVPFSVFEGCCSFGDFSLVIAEGISHGFSEGFSVESVDGGVSEGTSMRLEAVLDLPPAFEAVALALGVSVGLRVEEEAVVLRERDADLDGARVAALLSNNRKAFGKRSTC